MDAAALKAELLRLLAEDADFRAGLVEAMFDTPPTPDVIAALTAAAGSPKVEPPEAVFAGPAWLAPKAAQGGPQTKKRFSA